MRQRYEVYDNGKWFASINAESADDAIRIACNKTGTDPENCIAVEATDGRPKKSGQ